MSRRDKAYCALLLLFIAVVFCIVLVAILGQI